MKSIALLFVLSIHLLAFSQLEIGSLYEELPLDSIASLSLRNHNSIKPIIRTVNQYEPAYSITGQEKSLVSKAPFYLTPIIDAGAQFDLKSSFRAGAGLSLVSNKKSKLFYSLSAIEGFGQGDSSAFRPQSYVTDEQGSNQYYYTDIRGRVSYTPNSIFNFQAGLDHNFIGEGNRSMLLGDFGKPYPFAAIRTNFWRVEYMMLYQFLREEKANGSWKAKNGATHLLSLNVTKWFNISIFESVMFAPTDISLNRGYDAEYLNPIVFYRPQEYSIGSSDNVLMGLQFSVRYQKHTLYGQFMLDEFLLSEIRAKSRWWGNKYSGQLGIKGRFIEQNEHLFYRIESNFARPYTYSHVSSSQNYGNQGTPLAHPYGASFAEILGELKWQKKKWIVKGIATYFLHGADKGNGFSYGGDIYTSYNIRPYEYLHKIGQGIPNKGVRIMISTAYQLKKATNLQVFMEHHLLSNTAYSGPGYQCVIGVRSCLWNDYRNY